MKETDVQRKLIDMQKPMDELLDEKVTAKIDKTVPGTGKMIRQKTQPTQKTINFELLRKLIWVLNLNFPTFSDGRSVGRSVGNNFRGQM